MPMSQDRFHEEIRGLKAEVVTMAEFAKGMMCDSVTALKNQDVKLAESVISKKKAIAEMDDRIEEKALLLLTLHQPMASDMRTIAACLKIITYLARIGRYGKDIAVVARDTADRPHVKKIVHIPQMNEKVCSMVTDTIAAFDNCDISYIKDMTVRDSEVDEMRYGIYRECLALMMADPKNIDMCTNYIMVARYLERCGDHACKMAEKVYYMVTGERVEFK